MVWGDGEVEKVEDGFGGWFIVFFCLEKVVSGSC